MKRKRPEFFADKAEHSKNCNACRVSYEHHMEITRNILNNYKTATKERNWGCLVCEERCHSPKYMVKKDVWAFRNEEIK